MGDEAPPPDALSLELEAPAAEQGANGHVSPPSLGQVKETIDAWLATIEIGGGDERGYDSTDLATFAVEHGLEREEPELIYKSFVDLRVGTADAREKEAAAEKLASGTQLVVEDRDAGRSFVLDEELWVVELQATGAAEAAGVEKGMRLIGFQGELIQRNVKWARLRTYAKTLPLPHTFVFSSTNAEAGQAAVTAHAEAQAAAEAEAEAAKEAEALAARKLKAEVDEALTTLTTDDEELQPAKQMAAIEHYGKDASLAASEHVVSWLCERLGEATAAPVAIKAISVLSKLGQSGSLPMRGELLRAAKPALETCAREFSCAPDEKLGDVPQQLVRTKAAECIAVIEQSKDPAASRTVSTPGARRKVKASASEAALVAGLKVEVTRDNADQVGFLVDETLFVVAVSAGGLADKAGVLPGMSLIGFGQQHVDTTPKIKNAYLQWTVVRKMAASTAFPHLYTFALVDKQKGAAAVEVFLGISASSPGGGKKEKRKEKKATSRQEKKATPQPQQPAAAALKLPDESVHVEISEEAAKSATRQDFVVDDRLWVCELNPEGLAAAAGVQVGMSLVGFGKRAVDGYLYGKTATWPAIRSAAARTSFPHTFSFADVDPEAGKQALAEYRAAKEAAAAKQAEARAAGEKLKAEIEEALELLSTDDEAPAPEKQQTAIVKAGASAAAPTAEHISQWLGLRVASAESPNVRLKTMDLILALLSSGSAAMKSGLVSNCMDGIALTVEFRCDPHPELGEKPQELVRLKAAECQAKLQGKKWKPPKAKKQKQSGSNNRSKQQKKAAAEYVPRDYVVELGPAGMVKQRDEILLEVPAGGLKKAGFKCSPGLWVTLVEPEGKAENVGVEEGMRLVGFGTERLDRTIDWDKLQAFAAKTKPPHTFLFTNQPAEEVEYEVVLGPTGFVQQSGEISFDVGPAETPGFECKEQGLVVSSVTPDGKAECSGISVGMTLIGFQTDRLDSSKLTWSKVKSFAAKTAPPHTYIFTNETSEIPEGVPPTDVAAQSDTVAPQAEVAAPAEPAAEVDAAAEPSAACAPEADDVPAPEPEPAPEPAPAPEPEPEQDPA